MKQTLIIAVIGTCAAITAGYYIYKEPVNKEIARQELTPEIIHSIAREIETETTNTVDISPSSIQSSPNTDIAENIKIYKELGYSQKAAEAMANHDIKYELTYDDLVDPKDKKNAIDYYNEFKANGYMEEPESQIAKIFKAMDNVYSVGNDFSRLAFEASKTGDVLNSDYTYKGYSYNLDPNETAKMQYLMRSYENGKAKLVILESSTNDGGEYSLKPYITHHINGHPAEFMKVVAHQSKRSLYKMNVINPKFSYQLYMSSDKNEKEVADELARIAKNLFDANGIS